MADGDGVTSFQGAPVARKSSIPRQLDTLVFGPVGAGNSKMLAAHRPVSGGTQSSSLMHVDTDGDQWFRKLAAAVEVCTDPAASADSSLQLPGKLVKELYKNCVKQIWSGRLQLAHHVRLTMHGADLMPGFTMQTLVCVSMPALYIVCQGMA